MHKIIRRAFEKLNIVLVLMLAMVLTGGLGGMTYILAANTATQEASTSQATNISVVGKVADTGIATITFPEAAPNATVSNPYNNVDTVTDSQVVAAENSEPVARLKNTSGGTLNVTLEITTWTNSVVASEDYELVATTATDVSEVNDVLSADGNTNSVETGVSMTTDTYKALYLELVLSSVAAKTASSTLTVLGETP